MWKEKPWENKLTFLASKKTNPPKSTKQASQSSWDILQTFLVDHDKHFSVPFSCGGFWKTSRRTLKSWQSLVVSRTKNYPNSLLPHLVKTKWVWKLNGSERLRWFECHSALKLKTVKSWSYQNYNRRKIWKGHKEKAQETKAEADDEQVEEASIPLVTQLTTFALIFFQEEVYINNQQLHKSNELYA